MMKKYFLKGKEYLNKKLQQFDIDTSSLDFIGDQIPNRLKEPLAVLRNTQIDLEDTQQYEAYFKNYPNHHLSHFLLDKYCMLQQAHADAPQYIPPNNKNSYIPSFDDVLQKKALLLKQAIQQYDEGYYKIDQPVICMCVIHFHHKRGTQIQYRYPKNKTVESIQNSIVHHAMPDSSHNKHQDYNFFNFQTQLHGKNKMLFGVSYFKQIKLTQQMKKKNPQLTRSYVQKAIAIVSTLPLFGYLKMRLSITTKVFFQQFTNFDIIQMAYKDLNKHLTETWPQIGLNDLNIGSDLRKIISLFGAGQFYEIWKSMLYQKRIVVYAHSSSSASSFILSLISLFPGLNTFGIFSKPISKYMQALRQFALPLRLFNSQNFMSMSFHIQDFHLLSKFIKTNQGNFLLGTTNRLLKETNNDYGIQLLVNLENCSIEKRKARRGWQGLSKKQKTFISQLDQMVNQPKSDAYGYSGSQDCIRNHFHNFLKGILIQMAASIKLFRKFMKDYEQYTKNSHHITEQKVQTKKSSYQQMNDQIDPDQANGHKKDAINNNKSDFPPLLPAQVSQMVLPQLLLNKSFAYFLQFHNQSLPEILKGQIYPSLYINNYDYYLRINQEKFIAYNWMDKKLLFGNGPNLRNYQGKQIRFSKIVQNSYDQPQKDQAKSIYIGNVMKGKFHKNGFYVDQFEHFEGQYNMGAKEGYGKYCSPQQKYIGDFKNNLYEGQGQLIVGEDIYVGEFKQGLRDGYGYNQGSLVFQGKWQNDKPVYQTEKVQNACKQQKQNENNKKVQTQQDKQILSAQHKEESNNEQKIEVSKNKQQVQQQASKTQSD